MKFNAKTPVFYLLCLLLIFLPFSSWLISLTGIASLTLIRDVLIGLMFVLALINPNCQKFDKRVIWLVSLFIAWGVVSYFWREASAMQWLKGFRFTFLPLFFFLSVWNFDFNSGQKSIIYKLIFGGAIVILIFAIFSLFGINVPMTTTYSGQGALASVHYVGNSLIPRLQSVLAGPNALGLYLIAIIGLLIGNLKSRKIAIYLFVPAIIILVLTFSRSALIGLLVMALVFVFLILKKKIGAIKSAFLITIVSLIIIMAGFFAYKSPTLQNYFTHDNSSSLRYEQYQRIWDTKAEIGLFGRGAGTAGPSSQARLDGGENHWTENVYLDIFEELGFVGLCLYLAMILTMIYLTYKQGKDKSAFLIAISFAVTGIFINYYTGQVGIFLMWLAIALTLNTKKDTDEQS